MTAGQQLPLARPPGIADGHITFRMDVASLDGAQKDAKDEREASTDEHGCGPA